MQLLSGIHREILWNGYVNGRGWLLEAQTSKINEICDFFLFLCIFFSDINDCVNHTCENGAACLDGINSYACNCTTGFTGAYCETGNYWNHKEKHVTSLAQPLSNDQVQICNCSFVIFFQPLTSVSNTLRVIISWPFHVTILIVVPEWVKHFTVKKKRKKEKEKKIWREKTVSHFSRKAKLNHQFETWLFGVFPF